MASYQDLFWLFMLGNILGVLIEGVWCFVRYGQWETHTMALWGAFNIVYGIGVPVFFMGCAQIGDLNPASRFLVFALLGSLVEYLCGMIIRVGIGMRAWDYHKGFMNIQGLISLPMTLIWGVLGLGFHMFLYQPLMHLLAVLHGGWWDITCVCLIIFMAINLLWTALCIIRWANRHHGKAARNRLSRWLDRKYPDSRMKKRFFYWYFIDDPGSAGHPHRRTREK